MYNEQQRNGIAPPPKMTTPDLLPFVLILILLIIWLSQTARVGAGMIFQQDEMWIPTAWLVWFASMIVGSIMGQWVSLVFTWN